MPGLSGALPLGRFAAVTSLGHDRRQATALDDADELRAFYERFVVAGDGVIYLDGNSLGRLPRGTPARVAEVVCE